jgi:hypothetical protein
MNKEYKIKLDLNKKLYNKKMAFNQFDENVNDFYIEVTKNNKVVKDLDKSIITLVAIKPNGEVDVQFIEFKEGQIYANLKPSMCDLVGNYQAKAMIVLEGEIVTTDTINYSVNEDKIISRLNDDIVSDERFTLFTDALARLSIIEISEEQRMINEAERILSEENRKIEEAKRVEAELIRQHEEADRAKYDAIRESNENIRKQNESIRLANETNRIDEEAKRVEEENKRKLAEEERKANYDFMTEDEERRRSEANVHKEAEILRVQAETNRVNEEAKRRTTEQARVSAENTRVSNENTREANEVARKNNETQRVEAETQRQNRYNSFITEAEANANNFENYTNNAKAKEEERKANELDRKSQENRRVSNENERVSSENSRKANEVVREENEISRQGIFEDKVDEFNKKIVELNTTKDNFVSSINTKVDNKISEIDNAKTDMSNTVSNKVNEVENRFNALTSKQQQDAEVIDARDGETSLKARLDRDIEKAKQIYVNVEGSNISTDSSSGYLKDVEILGNTIQDASNLADIRSVGDKIEGQELYEIPVLSYGKNLFDGEFESGTYSTSDGTKIVSPDEIRSKNVIKLNSKVSYSIKAYNYGGNIGIYKYDKSMKYIERQVINNNSSFTVDSNTDFITIRLTNTADLSTALQIEEGTQATPYEPYVEDKLTILSPVQLEKVGDVADRIIEKDGVWGVEKNIETLILNGSESSWITQNSISPAWKRFVIQNIEYMDTAYDYSNPNKTLCDSFVYDIEDTKQDSTYLKLNDGVGFYKNDIDNLSDFKSWVAKNNILLKYIRTQPQFIPLPHSQQVKLRTFASKTNISFGCEIEGTIKAQVPKSLGATVNTHTEQIRSLNNELNRVKKLEESTVSTVTTESDFTTVEATSNGYFEDVKLEGKTLVNIASVCGFSKVIFDVTTTSGVCMLQGSQDNLSIKPNTKYTFIYNVINTPQDRVIAVQKYGAVANLWAFPSHTLQKGLNVFCFTSASNVTTNKSWTSLGLDAGESIGKFECSIIILEGDHTQNPPSYFEGLKSVGQSATTSEDGADEIVVSSVKGDGNLFDESLLSKYITPTDANEYTLDYTTMYNDNFIYPVNGDGQYTFSYTCKETVGNKNPRFIFNYDDGSFENINSPSNGFTRYSRTSNANKKLVGIKVAFSSVGGNWIIQKDSIMFNKGTTPKPYTPHQSDKKRLLYYNEETQTWEKPILRQWDSIEKHADGKYYYHQRSAEVVLNGSENYVVQSDFVKQETTIGFSLGRISDGTSKAGLAIGLSDRFSVKTQNYLHNVDKEGFTQGYNRLYFRINKSKLSTQDVQGFKQWLQANPTTVVYQLAEEKIYECTNIDLITYANETNYIVECGAIAPKSTLKVHNNISNVVSLLQKKVSLLESNVKASQEVQDMMILETDMRMLDIELALMEFIPMKLNLLGGSDMLRSATYFNFLKNHIINETYEKEYLENVMNKYLATGRINQDEYDELYKMLYPPVYDIELPIEY